MSQIVTVQHSGYGHTATIAEAGDTATAKAFGTRIAEVTTHLFA